MSEHRHSEDLRRLREHYAALVREHGDGPAAVQQSDVETQERRMAVLAEVGEMRTAKVLDFGCGTAHLLDFLVRTHRFCGEYVGYDICPDMVEAASRKFPGVRFEARDIFAYGIPEKFDYVLVNGVFNNRISDNWGFLTDSLQILFSSVRRAVAFNCLSTYVDYFAQGLWYADPGAVFRFCKENLSPCVTLRHDYLVKEGVVPYEFSVYVYRSGIQPRCKMEMLSRQGCQPTDDRSVNVK